MELGTTAGVALMELLATEGSSSLKLSVMVGTRMTLSLIKQLKSILTGLSSEMFPTGQSLVNKTSFPKTKMLLIRLIICKVTELY